MILSVSRRTDVPAFYADWFYNRLAAGEVETVNPYNPQQVSRISLLPQDVDGFVFWTKDPSPMLPRLAELGAYAYYFTVTITPYTRELEPYYAPRRQRVIDAARELGARLGPHRVHWRYDPMLFGAGYSAEWHAESYRQLARLLKGATDRCIIGFYDNYKHLSGVEQTLGIKVPSDEERLETVRLLAEAAKAEGIPLQSCSEELDYAELGVQRGACIDAALMGEIAGHAINAKKDKNQRAICLCAESKDIGAYNTCPGGCVYCYALRSHKAAAAKYRCFDTTAGSLA